MTPESPQPLYVVVRYPHRDDEPDAIIPAAEKAYGPFGSLALAYAYQAGLDAQTRCESDVVRITLPWDGAAEGYGACGIHGCTDCV